VRGILADLRSQKRSAAPRHGIKVAGVTQGNRQAVVAKLRDGMDCTFRSSYFAKTLQISIDSAQYPPATSSPLVACGNNRSPECYQVDIPWSAVFPPCPQHTAKANTLVSWRCSYLSRHPLP